MKRCAYCGRENEDAAVRCLECGTDEFQEATTAISAGEPPDPRARWQTRVLTQEELAGEWVTLTTCQTLVEADLIVSELGAGGISAFIPDEFLMQAAGWALNTYGYVRVQIRRQDYESAVTFLAAAEAG